ncbi:MAG: 16S rRNA (guanine(527)-N(7))-methyltransferase RsmG [Alphaproteobacteria bacterium 16-39-46]|nr:MAG: 16S rRNA (guanine(527)-N(7))-methyltransferase RsmG [Alphaproteobacteria bacterium 16-39-46]OZA42480.1 MAG: 16S rRNA (guanine(527)-N(7))-methyltransferase RsmG [Alphaproteobacteria bacterium 17-39-52]HQS84436.1 16S rRNA (guanine(527)-N(7))-methyltransferase RsmG [Alphaproteobacteria bacterium]HQS94392.1 16S rRNA (guanine(527)-N(7))-methyltransferase RsmG [Alphaproteobacteria bacterium]
MNPYETYKTFWEALTVSRETVKELSFFVDKLQKKQIEINLISRNSSDDFWLRHVIDSAQLTKFVSRETTSGSDFGSGGGLPGVVLSILNPQIEFKLIESRAKKAEFLNEVVQEMSLNAKVFHDRIENLTHWKEDLITARALAPLEKLIPLLFPFVKNTTTLILPKGKNVQNEIIAFEKKWSAEIESHKSLTSEEGTILVMRDLKIKF